MSSAINVFRLLDLNLFQLVSKILFERVKLLEKFIDFAYIAFNYRDNLLRVEYE